MSENDISYGGQAVISGVLIQSPKGWSVAVRNQNNEIVKFFKERTPLVRRPGIFKLPLMRVLEHSLILYMLDIKV